MDDRIKFINITIKELNSCVDDIYESLIDELYEECDNHIVKLIDILKDLRTTFTEDL